VLAKQFEHNCFLRIYAIRSSTVILGRVDIYARGGSFLNTDRSHWESYVEEIYFWKFCHSTCVFGLDVKEVCRSDAIDGLKSSMALRQKGMKLKPRRNFGFILDGLLP